MTTYLATITPTTRPAGRGHAWQRWQEFTIRASTKKALLKKLEAYGTPRYPIYCDRKDGTTYKAGMIYTCTEQEDGHTFYRQNWVSLYSVHPVSEEE